MSEVVDRSWRLLPSEEAVWEGGPAKGVPRDLRWSLIPGLCFAMAAIMAAFSGLLYVAELPAVRSSAFTAFYLVLTGVSVALLPQYLLDPCRYMVTDRHVIWRRGRLRRTIERNAITFARIHWHRSVPGVGHLELVRAVPFGPLSRKQRIVLHDVRGPDRLLALIRHTEPAEFAGYADVRLTDRLDRGEQVIWGAGPAGWRLGRAELVIAGLGVAVLGIGLFHAYRTGLVLVGLERLGLPVLSWTWALLFGAIALSGAIIIAVGATLLWNGVWGARAHGSETEYVLTDSRLIIRRGLTELSVDRRRIVDVADLPSSSGSHNLHLILDGENARALDDSGALSLFSVPRATVPPVLYEVTERELLRRLLLDRRSGDSVPPPVDTAA